MTDEDAFAVDKIGSGAMRRRLISKGHPLGATGLAQCAELTWQLRAAVVTAYRPADR